jgi:HEAT repeat protein
MADSAEKKEPDPTVAALRNGPDYIRLAKLAELLNSERIDPETAAAVEGCLNDENHAVRELATVVMGQVRPGSIIGLTKALDAAQPTSVRIHAASGLAKAGRDAAPACESLVSCLDAKEAKLRWHSAFALGKIGQLAISPLRPVLKSKNIDARCSALEAFGWMGQEALEAFDDLKNCPLSPPPELPKAWFSALRKVSGDDVRRCSPAIEQALANPDATVRRVVVESIGELRGQAGALGPAVAKVLKDQSPEVRIAAIRTLSRIEPDVPAATDALVPLLRDGSTEIRTLTAATIGGFGPPASKALPALREMQRDKDARLVAIANAAILRLSEKQS